MYLKGKRYGGPCLATNPIDRCWRCQPNWHLNRKRLADCVLGFGYKTTDGKAGKFYVVTDNSDDSSRPKPESLRHAVIQKEPLWIIFARSMNIRLTEELIMQGDKIIDGRGAHVNIIGGAGRGVMGMAFQSMDLPMFGLIMSLCFTVEGLIDAIEGSTAITISNSHFTVIVR
ncbi:putative pectate lyase P59 [Camellia lanceoleosa]|uniref:Pectate lyase P59 n=1 Tax=Camellia lanceoleosa TaxID=1840588 RepID=A0ACC0I7F8_9ERIC|nr:putative pectate lyase P59 [Camellia lanceoleosa]